MESPILKQIAEFLQDRKKQKRWMVVFVFMAVIVGFGTAAALRMMGQAMTQKEKVLDCQLQLHEHTKACYDKNKNVICGYADYVVHKHNDDCYTSQGKLMCRLPEVEKHEHTKACYEKTETLVCGQDETDGHKHTDDCYTTEKGDLKCKKEEHSHSDGCYDEEGNLVCGLDEHQHDDDCYKWEDVLVCGAKEGEGGHKHTDKCYDVQEALTCGKLEMHTHTDKCFEKIDKNGKDEPGNLKLICTKTELIEHTHTTEAECLRTVDAAEADVIQAELEKEAEEESGEITEDGREIFTTDLDGEETEGDEASEGEEAGEETEGEAVEGEAGEESEEAEAENYEASKTYEGLGYIVTASYNNDANIPEEAKLVAERITEESDEDSYKKHEAEFKKNMEDEEATLSALFKIGFYVDGEEVEPETPVMITIQFVDKNGLPEGAPVKVVHFGDEETEVLDGGKAESGSTSFKTDSFSVFGVGFNKETDADEASVHISEDYEYEGNVFHVTFHVEGDAKVKNNQENPESEETDDELSNGEVLNNDASVNEDEEESDNTQESSDDVQEASKEQQLEFKVKELDKDSEEYKAAVEHVKSENDGSEPLLVQPLSYSMYYEGKELDLADCKVTAKVGMADALNKQISNSVPDAISYLRSEEGAVDNSKSTVDDALQTEVTVAVLGEDKTSELGRMVYDGKSANREFEFEASDEGDNSNTMTPYISTQANPNFTVQYYANLDRVSRGVSQNDTVKKTLDVIDTAKENGGSLPKNGVTPKTTTIGLKANGDVYTENKLTEVYAARPFEYIKAPTIKYFNALVDNKGYTLKQIWVHKHQHEEKCYTKQEDGSLKLTCTEVNATSIDENDWMIYNYLICENNDKSHTHDESCYDPDLHFTNRTVTAEENDKFVLIKQDATIRLVYDVVKKDEEFKSTFYDYDISNGNVRTDGSAKIINTSAAGINSINNCNADVKYAFGNQNAGTNYGLKIWDGNYLNSGNYLKDDAGDAIKDNNKLQYIGYMGCTFGLVSSVKGTDVNFKVDAPKVFGNEEQEGKTIYANKHNLVFKREGDTYTLSSVTDTETKDLQKFKNTTGTIWSNNFWPMDSAPSWGTAGHDMKFGNSANKLNLRFEPGDNKWTTALPPSDDGVDHNSYFGMYYEVPFEIPEDYTGPLEYLFFGDDDMWVFLDDKTLVCDIGGVHSSVGEYVNLWDYVKKPGKHTLKFFYTERGASGSSCWMHFTLPSVTSATPETSTKEYGQLRVEKTVTTNSPELFDKDDLDELLNRDTFKFKLEIEGAKDDYSYTKYEYVRNEQGELTTKEVESNLIIWDGGNFTLKNNQYIIVSYLPRNAKYKVTENDEAVTITEVTGEDDTVTTEEKPSDKSYFTDITAENVSIESKGDEIIETTIQGTQETKEDLIEKKEIDGTIPENGVSKVHYTNKFQLYELPKTGGSGIMIYTIAGVLCITLGAGFMYRKKARERRA